jgi:hypothetical protein
LIGLARNIDLALYRDSNEGNSKVVAAFCKVLGPSGNQNPPTQFPGSFLASILHAFTPHAASTAKL